MLLSQLIASQQDQYQAIQAQIEALQEQQRQIQSYLQRLGSVESQMESAAKLMQEAVASIRQECPDELPAYQSLINGFFGQAPIAVLNASVDTDPQPEVTTPAPSDSWTEIDEDIDSYYKANPVVETENTTLETTAVVVEEDDCQDPEERLQEKVGEEGESQPELDFSGLTWVQIKRLASSMGIDINRRKRPHMEKALTDIGITQSEIAQFLKG
uniref:Uncharacterized protein n=3 Tax=Nostocales TaxID=1161 RepID=A0A0C1R166_9CYAN